MRQAGGRTQHPFLKPSEWVFSVQNSLALSLCPSVAAGYGHYWNLENRGVLLHCCHLKIISSSSNIWEGRRNERDAVILWVFPVWDKGFLVLNLWDFWAYVTFLRGGFLTLFLSFQVLPLTRAQPLGLLCPELQVSVIVLCFRLARKMYQFSRWVPKKKCWSCSSPPSSHNGGEITSCGSHEPAK